MNRNLGRESRFPLSASPYLLERAQNLSAMIATCFSQQGSHHLLPTLVAPGEHRQPQLQPSPGVAVFTAPTPPPPPSMAAASTHPPHHSTDAACRCCAVQLGGGTGFVSVAGTREMEKAPRHARQASAAQAQRKWFASAKVVCERSC